MFTKEELQKRLKAVNINVNVLDMTINKEYVWFAFSFDEKHTERTYDTLLDGDLEDDALILTDFYEDEEDVYAEAVNCVMYSRLNPNHS